MAIRRSARIRRQNTPEVSSIVTPAVGQIKVLMIVEIAVN